MAIHHDLATQIDAILAAHDGDPSKLVGILLEVQDAVPERYIPVEAAAYVGERLGVPLGQVYDVITFYAALSLSPRAKNLIQVCDSVVCGVVGNTALKTTLEELVGARVGEVSADGLYALETTPCFGACDVAPAIRLNGKVYGQLTTVEKIKQVLSEGVRT